MGLVYEWTSVGEFGVSSSISNVFKWVFSLSSLYHGSLGEFGELGVLDE